MLKLKDYLEHAADCRRVASAATSVQIRDSLIKMAEAWEELAEHRRKLLEKKKARGERVDAE